MLEVQAERDSANNEDECLPHVMPRHLVHLHGRDFAAIVKKYQPRLSKFWDAQSIADIETAHMALRDAYRTEPALRNALDKCDHRTSFKESWAFLTGRSHCLLEFCGGLASIFANTATVESDFSVLGLEKDEYRLSLTDLSLEGIMHAKNMKPCPIYD